jgi:ATP-binding cassette subfamily B protein
MLKLLKYLKPFTWLIILIFVLLFGQAMADLSLPDYMSKIVNIGIQQNGIENAAPEAIRASEMDKIFLFMNDDEKALVNKHYSLIDESAQVPSGEPYYQDFANLTNGPWYILKTTAETDIPQLNSIFEKPIVLVAGIEQKGLDSFGDMFKDVPADTDPFTVLEQLPPAQMAALRDAALQQTSAMPPSVINQSAIAYVSAEYKMINVDVSHLQTMYIFKIGGFMLLLTLAGTALSVTVGFLSARIAAAFGRNSRKQIFERVESFSNTEFDKFSTASLITRTTNDIQQIQMVLVMLLRVVFYAPLLGIGGIIKAIGQDASLAWIIAAAVGALLMMIIIVFLVAVPKFKVIQQMIDKLNLRTREMLTGLMVIRAFNTQDYEEKKFDQANTDLTKTNLFIQRVMVFMMPAMNLLMSVSMLAVIWFGAKQVDAGTMQVGNMMAFMQYTMQIIMAFLFVSMVFIMLPRAAVSAQRVAEVIETEPIIKDPVQPRSYNGDVRGQIEFQDVSFKYPGAEDYVLQNVSFVTRPGQTTAIVGGTGSGKSTLINLIPRFYDATEGKIMVNNLDVREVMQHDLRNKIGYSPQKTTLFTGTIESNLKYANEQATEEEISRAAEIAQSMDFIKESQKGMQTAVAQGGQNFSGGQKQRLAIARALVKKPEIYIFDDSFSAVDYKTDAALRRALKNETNNATVLIVGQRISTIRNADQIIVLDKGKVVGIGTHKQLMEKCDVYQELALSQLSREELVE